MKADAIIATVFLVRDGRGVVLGTFKDRDLAEDYRAQYCWYIGRSDGASVTNFEISHLPVELSAWHRY
jgi:hypothetical protein